MTISEYDDILDTRSIVERIEELESEIMDAEGDELTDLTDELTELRTFADELRDYAADFEFGEAVIRDSYFEDYAREVAEDCGMVKDDAEWPLRHIDWEAAADELKQDYTTAEWRGVTYWVR